jgi:2-phospho-L-lactate guanylyltransferase
MIAALVPVKRLGAAKSRLLPRLARADLARLTLAMLGDLIEALRHARCVDLVWVVTEDEEAARAARDAGAHAVVTQAPSLNPALDEAATELSAAGARGTLVVLGDVAGALPADLDAMHDALRALGGAGVVLAPARDGGSAALLRVPPSAIRSAFGPASAAAHRALARAARVPFRELRLASLEIDIDRPEDVDALLATRDGAPRTRELLRALGWAHAC